MLERLHDFIERSFEPARSLASERDFQDQPDRWFAEQANARIHRTLRAVPAEHLEAERPKMRAPPGPMPELDRSDLGLADPDHDPAAGEAAIEQVVVGVPARGSVPASPASGPPLRSRPSGSLALAMASAPATSPKSSLAWAGSRC